jgi:3-isopropylmalate/(R)-2-methylmalate dehydratase large subunit
MGIEPFQHCGNFIMSMTFAEKILSAKAGLPTVSPGQILTIEPDVALSHDNTAAICRIFKHMGA